jgi:hypothetical protein
VTPPPLASPRLLWDQHHPQSTELSTVAPTSDTNNWIVAYGYSNREEYQELVRILNGYGQILQQQSNGNWLAVKYESRLAAEKALCSQPIRLTSNSLCGTVRGAAQLLQSLRDQQRNEALKTTTTPSLSSSAPSFAFPSETMADNQHMTQSNGLEEKDILAQYNKHDGDDSHRRPPTSVCEKLLAWFFEWDSTTHHSHSD